MVGARGSGSDTIPRRIPEGCRSDLGWLSLERSLLAKLRPLLPAVQYQWLIKI